MPYPRRIPSKFDLRRFCRATGATALVAVTAPSPEELGFAMELTVEEVGGHNCTVLRQDGETGAIATVVLRASTDNLLDDLERAIDDGVNSYKVSRAPESSVSASRVRVRVRD